MSTTSESSNIITNFNQAIEEIQQWTTVLPEGLFEKYVALYRQATLGNCNIGRPQGEDHRESVLQWNAWKELNGMERDEAMTKFINLVNERKAQFRVHKPNAPTLKSHFEVMPYPVQKENIIVTPTTTAGVVPLSEHRK